MDNYKLFITIVELGSFSKAAEQRGITQPTVSKQIDRLEERLGSQLFKRSTRQLILTAAGERYYERAKEIDALVRATEREIRHIAHKDEAMLRVATSPALADAVLPHVLKPLAKLHPDARFQLIVEDTTQSMYYQRNFELEYDLFIREGEGAESNMSARPLGDVPLGFYASPKYLQEYGHPRSISELNDNHRCLLGRMDRSNPWVDKMLGDLPFQWDWEIISNLTVCLISHAEEGLGVLFVAQHLVQRALERGTLVEVKLDIDLPKMPVTALYRREYLSPLARDCLDLLIKHMEENYPRDLSPPSAA